MDAFVMRAMNVRVPCKTVIKIIPYKSESTKSIFNNQLKKQLYFGNGGNGLLATQRKQSAGEGRSSRGI
jgi:hypothetical protein